MAANSTFKIVLLFFCLNLVITSVMASFSVRGRGVRTRGGRGRGRGSSSTPSRLDNNMFAVLSEPGDFEQDGDDFDIHDNSYLDMTVGFDGAENDWNLVRSKQT